jgi:hypothetical protein
LDVIQGTPNRATINPRARRRIHGNGNGSGKDNGIGNGIGNGT